MSWSGSPSTDRERHALVSPVVEVRRRVAVNPHLGRVPRLPFDLVLAEPVVATFEIEDAATVGVDVHSTVVGPDLARLEGVAIAGEDRRQGQKSEAEGEERGCGSHEFPFLGGLPRSTEGSPPADSSHRDASRCLTGPGMQLTGSARIDAMPLEGTDEAKDSCGRRRHGCLARPASWPRSTRAEKARTSPPGHADEAHEVAGGAQEERALAAWRCLGLDAGSGIGHISEVDVLGDRSLPTGTERGGSHGPGIELKTRRPTAKASLRTATESHRRPRSQCLRSRRISFSGALARPTPPGRRAIRRRAPRGPRPRS